MHQFFYEAKQFSQMNHRFRISGGNVFFNFFYFYFFRQHAPTLSRGGGGGFLHPRDYN